jgi:hypothetical protein
MVKCFFFSQRKELVPLPAGVGVQGIQKTMVFLFPSPSSWVARPRTRAPRIKKYYLG